MRCFYTTPPPSIPLEQLTSGSRRVSRQSCSPVGPAEYPARAARQWIPPSISPELLASGSRRVSRQSCLPVDPAEYPARAACQWIPPRIPPEQLASESLPVSRELLASGPERLTSGSRQVSHQSGSPVDSAKYPTTAEYPAEYPRVARWRIPPNIPPEDVDPAKYPAENPLPMDPADESCQYQAGAARQYSPVDPASIPPEQLASLVLLNLPSGAQLGLRFMLVPSFFEWALRLGKGDAFVLLWVANKQLRLIPRRVSVGKGLGFC